MKRKSELTDDELLQKTKTSIASATLPTGLPVPRDIKRASSALVAACEEKLAEINDKLADGDQEGKPSAAIDREIREDLEDERENTRNLLIQIEAANTKPKRTWEEFWEDNAALCALVKPKAIAWEIGRLLIQAIAVAGVAAALALFVFPPLGIILAALVVAAFCAYKVYSTANAIGKAWDKSNENLASRQLDQGQTIKEKHQQRLNDTLTEAKEAKEETAAELTSAQGELNQAETKVNTLTEELASLNTEKAQFEAESSGSEQALLHIASEELAVLQTKSGEIVDKLRTANPTDKAGIKKKLDLNNKAILDKNQEIAALKEPVAKIQQLSYKIKAKTHELNLATIAREVKQRNVITARQKDTDAGNAVTNAQKAVNKLKPTLSPLAKVSAPPNINPATGRTMQQENSKGYQQGYTQPKSK